MMELASIENDTEKQTIFKRAVPELDTNNARRFKTHISENLVAEHIFGTGRSKCRVDIDGVFNRRGILEKLKELLLIEG